MKQEFVTLPREVVEQAVEALFCTDSEEGSTAYKNELEAVKKLRAALEQSQGEQEPVAKVVLTEQLGLPCLQWLDLDRQFDFKGGELLYTHPQPKREPLTDAQIDAIMTPLTRGVPYSWRAFARAIERAHNIK